MATNLNMARWYDMQEGTLVRWLKSVGDEVSLGDAVAEIETDKAVVEFESTAEGVLLELIVEEGTTVAVGESIATVGVEGETLAADGDVAEESTEAEPVGGRAFRVGRGRDARSRGRRFRIGGDTTSGVAERGPSVHRSPGSWRRSVGSI